MRHKNYLNDTINSRHRHRQHRHQQQQQSNRQGLGTSTAKEAKEYFAALDTHQLEFEWKDDSRDNDLIDMAFSKKRGTLPPPPMACLVLCLDALAGFVDARFFFSYPMSPLRGSNGLVLVAFCTASDSCFYILPSAVQSHNGPRTWCFYSNLS